MKEREEQMQVEASALDRAVEAMAKTMYGPRAWEYADDDIQEPWRSDARECIQAADDHLREHYWAEFREAAQEESAWLKGRAGREYRVNAHDGIYGPFADARTALWELGEHQADYDDNGGPRPPELESRAVGSWEEGRFGSDPPATTQHKGGPQ